MGDQAETEDEYFEIVDYTSASPLERFITSIEAHLTSWGIDGGSLGIFDPSEWTNAVNDHADSPARTLIKKEVIWLGDSSYVLAYHYCPRVAVDDDDVVLSVRRRGERGVGNGWEEGRREGKEGMGRRKAFRTRFPSLNGTYTISAPPHTLPATTQNPHPPHSLHRYTGLSHLLILMPFSISEPFDGESIGGGASIPLSSRIGGSGPAPVPDLTVTKMLSSSFIVALHNTGCRVPAFFNTGPAWKALYAGVGLGAAGTLSRTESTAPPSGASGSDSKMEGAEVATGKSGRIPPSEQSEFDIERRYRMLHVPYVPPQYAHLRGLVELFKERIALDTGDYAADATAESDVESDTEDSGQIKPRNPQPGPTVTTTYRYKLDFDDDGWRAHYPRMEGDSDSFASNSTDSQTLNLPQIPFGPYFDPLRSLTLETYFSPITCASNTPDSYHQKELTCTASKTWYFSCAFRDLSNEQKLMALSQMLRNVLVEWANVWIDDEEDEGGDEEGLMEEEEGGGFGADVPGAMPGGGPGPGRDHRKKYVMKRGRVRRLVDAMDIRDAMRSLFRERTYSDPSYAKISASPPRRAFPLSMILAAQLQQTVGVPKRSLIWEFAVRVLDSVSPDSVLRFDAGVIGMLKGLWTDIVREIRMRWEEGEDIPGVDIWFGRPGGKGGDTASEEGSVCGIDLRYGLLYQKLQMINCCIARRRQRGEVPAKDFRRQLRRARSAERPGETPSGSSDARLRPLEEPGRKGQTRTPSPTNSTSSRISVRQTARGLLQPFVSTITDFTSGVANDYVPMARSTSDGGSKTSDAHGSTLVRLFDRLTSDHSHTPSQEQQPSRPPSRPISTPRNNTSTSDQPQPSYEGTSWTSDYSWEGFSRRESGAGVGGGGGGVVDGDVAAALADAVGGGGVRARVEDADDEKGSETSKAAGHDHEADREVFFDTMEDVPSGPTSRRQSNEGVSARGVESHETSDAASRPVSSLGTRTPASNGGHSQPVVGSVDSGGGMEQSFVQLGSDAAPATAPSPSAVIAETAAGEWEGRKRKVEGILLVETGEEMWEPDTQEPGYMTEDMIREQEQIFERLGTSDEAARIRARMQCAQLTSDMEAFKAANPNCTLADFVRWHSPRDWIKGADGEGGTLSARMTEPGNLWMEMWKTARRVPASRQKLLFDHVKEAERALGYLEAMGLREVFVCMLPIFFLIAYDTLTSHPLAARVRIVKEGLTRLAGKIGNVAWMDVGSPADTELLEDIVNDVQSVEARLAMGVSLTRKLPGRHDLVERLLAVTETKVASAEERESIYGLFCDDGAKFPSPTTREFVFEQDVRRSGPLGRKVGQRMYALLGEGEFRIFEEVVKDGEFW
ncbi:Rab3 GTPase-activating protein catalytic subunit [Rhizophlyctis rosea]|nr:Rab3 GTPase-activating protein catalytic subunit [Rhizophlyctis rosea]